MRNLQRFSSLTRNLLTPLNKKLKKMTKSALQIARAAYQPKLPKALASGAEIGRASCRERVYVLV